MQSTVKTGKKGEQYSKEYFINNGYEIQEQNWRHGKNEIDLIVKKENVICFVEVKTRTKDYLIEPLLSISTDQQKRIISTAHQYIMLHKLDLEIRFDIIGIVIEESKMNLKHLEDAFYPTLD